MKILHVITSLGQGGAEAMLAKVIAAARRQAPEIEHEVISLREMAVYGPRLQATGVPVLAMGMGGAIGTWRGWRQLLQVMRRQPSDVVVQTWMYHGDLIGGLAARLTGRPRVIWNLRQTGVQRRNVGTATYLVIRMCALLSRWLPRRIICCAESARTVHASLGYDGGRCVVVPNGFDTERFAPDGAARRRVRAELGLADSHRVVGLVARLDPQKDHRTLATAASLLCRDDPSVRLLWVGREVDRSAWLGGLLRELGIEDRVLRLGEREDVPALLSAMDVFCLSSRAEGFPNVLGEAMACALPCVTTDAGDARALLGDDRWVVPPEQPAALAATLARMLDCPEGQRRALGQANRARIVAGFGIDAIWQRYRSVYDQLT